MLFISLLRCILPILVNETCSCLWKRVILKWDLKTCKIAVLRFCARSIKFVSVFKVIDALTFKDMSIYFKSQVLVQKCQLGTKVDIWALTEWSFCQWFLAFRSLIGSMLTGVPDMTILAEMGQNSGLCMKKDGVHLQRKKKKKRKSFQEHLLVVGKVIQQPKWHCKMQISSQKYQLKVYLVCHLTNHT